MGTLAWADDAMVNARAWADGRRLTARRGGAQHQSLLAFVGEGMRGPDAKVLAKVRDEGVARDTTARIDRSMDHRRHRFPSMGGTPVGVARHIAANRQGR